MKHIYYICSICGQKHLKGLDMVEPPFDTNGAGSFDICSFCNTEFGYEIVDINDSNRLEILRHQILRRKNVNNFPKENIDNLKKIDIVKLRFEIEI